MLKNSHRLVILGSVLALACTEKGRSLVYVELDKDATLPVTSAHVVALEGGNVVGTADAQWPADSAMTLKLHVYVSKTVTGPVNIVGCGIAGGSVIASGSKSANVTPGQATNPPVAMPLTAAIDPNCGSVTTGLGGAGGAAAGAGGGAGTSGAAGTSAAGMGGRGGMGGGGAAGTTGAAGTGGVAGTTGVGGNGGRAGAGGAAGAGGRAGSAGGGTTGTGGGGRGGASAGAGGAAGTGGSGQVAKWNGAIGVGADPAIYETYPAVAVDPSGNAVVVYIHGSEVWANHYTAATNAWGTPVGIDTRAGIGVDQGGGVQVGVDKNGTFTALWATNENGSMKGIYSSLSTDGIHWSAITMIASGVDWTPALAVNADGAAVAAWTDSANNLWQVQASTRSSTSGAWSAPTTLRPGDDNGDRDPVVAISGTGEAFVGWTQSDPADNISVWMRQHTASGWNTAALMETFDTGPCYGISISANKTGSAMVTYLQIDSTTSLMSRRYTPTTGWAAALKAGEATDIEWLYAPSVTLDDAGTATAAFAYSIGGKFNVYTNRIGATDSAWAGAMAMETDNAAASPSSGPTFDQVPDPLVASDPSGNVTLIWRKRSGTRFDMWARRFSGGIWNPATILETRDTNTVWYPALAVGTDGTAVATWYYQTEYDVWANVYR